MPLSILPLVTARLAAEAGRLTFLRNYGKRIWIPAPFYLIQGADEPILVDTSGQADLMQGLRTEPVEHVMGFEDALAMAGLKPGDIRRVIHTHLMYDHCANSRYLPNAKFIVQKKEIDFALDPHPMFAGVYQRHLFETLPFEVIEGDHELMPGIRLLFTPGHTPGNQSVAVSTADGWTVITGFCCLAESFAPQKSPAWVTDRVPVVVPPGIHTDMLQAYESMLKVKNFADVIIPFHDPFSPARVRIAEKQPS
ncbi:MAG: N-acyl homoserine lactonase family protein [Deltaproteobacteria bacterium]|nr:N-acyl homoserine lactonase family protein [Deltaproteobacteria bacterium]